MKINSLSCSPDSAQRITQSGWPILWRWLSSSKNMAQIKTPAETNEKCVNMAIYTERFNGAEQSSLVGVEREEGVFGVWESWSGFLPDCSRPQKIKSFLSPKGTRSISGLINWSRVGFFFPQRLIYFNQHLMTGHCQVLLYLLLGKSHCQVFCWEKPGDTKNIGLDQCLQILQPCLSVSSLGFIEIQKPERSK